jgi:hypothetical protein
MNRAPAAYGWALVSRLEKFSRAATADRWWPDHVAKCGGAFLKIKEPPPKQKPAAASKKAGTKKETDASKRPAATAATSETSPKKPK